MYLRDKIPMATERQYSDEGFLIVPAKISRSGVYFYTAGELQVKDKNPEDVLRIYRPEKEVFDNDSLLSFANKPVTNDHPPELVNPSNSKKFAVGMSGQNVIKDGEFVKTSLAITDKETIKQIEAGKVELSNGYTAELEWAAGITPNGEHYDAVQRNIRGNHIAVVNDGRAGSKCKVADQLPQGEQVVMIKFNIDGVDFEMSEQAAQAVVKLQTRLRDSEKETANKSSELKTKEDDLEKEKLKAKKAEADLNAKLNDAKNKIPTLDSLDKLVAERAKIIDTARTVAPTLKLDGKSIDQVRREVLTIKYPDLNLKALSSDYINARFDALIDIVASSPTVSDSQGALNAALKSQLNADPASEIDNRPADVIAREKMIIDSRNAWKTEGK